MFDTPQAAMAFATQICHRGGNAILSVAGRGSEFDAGGAIVLRTRAHDCRFSRQRRDPIRAFGEGVTVSSEVDVGVIIHRSMFL